jgi:hypothetical protein
MAKTNDGTTNTHSVIKRRMKLDVVAAMLLVASAYFIGIFPVPVVEGILASKNEWLQLAYRTAVAAGIGSVAPFILFSSDSAFLGSSKMARWARGRFPSRGVKIPDCTASQADALWFRYFDTWALSTSPNHALMHATYAATYGARLVFHLRNALLIASIISAVTMLINHALLALYGGGDVGWWRLIGHVIITISFLSAWLTLGIANCVADEDDLVTGCWRRLADAYTRSSAVFDLEVLQGSKTVTEAFAKVEKMRMDLETKATTVAATK